LSRFTTHHLTHGQGSLLISLAQTLALQPDTADLD